MSDEVEVLKRKIEREKKPDNKQKSCWKPKHWIYIRPMKI